MKVLEIPLYIALAGMILGMVIVAGTNVYGIFELSRSGRHWDIQNGYGICPGTDLGCFLGTIVNTTLQYVPPKVIVYLGLVTFGSGTVAMFIGDQSERIPLEQEKES